MEGEVAEQLTARRVEGLDPQRRLVDDWVGTMGDLEVGEGCREQFREILHWPEGKEAGEAIRSCDVCESTGTLGEGLEDVRRCSVLREGWIVVDKVDGQLWLPCYLGSWDHLLIFSIAHLLRKRGWCSLQAHLRARRRLRQIYLQPRHECVGQRERIWRGYVSSHPFVGRNICECISVHWIDGKDVLQEIKYARTEPVPWFVARSTPRPCKLAEQGALTRRLVPRS